jgi:hypothetical protein
MNKLYTLTMVISITFSVFAQAPQKMSYQCVVRNASGVLVTNQAVGIRISILQGTATGTVIYQEIYNPNPQTNANGLVSLEIGTGLPITGTFASINWASGLYFLKTETDPTGGTSYTIAGTSQLLSVPYAMFSKNAGTADYNALSNLPNLNIANWNTSYAWGNHAGLYRSISYVPSWNDITSKPTTVAGYGITNAMTTSHPANVITSGNITNWNATYGWGNHASLYRTVGWVPTWTDVSGKPAFAAVATSGSYNDLSNKPTIINSQWTSQDNFIYYNSGRVGIGNAKPAATLDVDGTVVIGSEGKVFTEIRELVGVTNPSGNTTAIAYPTGYNMNTIRVLSIEIHFNSTLWLTTGYSAGTSIPIYCKFDQSSIVLSYPDVSSLHNQDYRILIMK